MDKQEDLDPFIERNRQHYLRKKNKPQQVVISDDMPNELDNSDSIPQTTIETLRDRLEEI